MLTQLDMPQALSCDRPARGGGLSTIGEVLCELREVYDLPVMEAVAEHEGAVEDFELTLAYGRRELQWAG